MKELDVIVRLQVDMPDDAEAMDYAGDILDVINHYAGNLECNPQFSRKRPWDYSVSDKNV